MSWGKVAYMVISTAISYYTSRKLLKQDDKNVQADDRPTSTTTRGAWLPLLMGRRRVAPVIAWIQNRVIVGSNVREDAGHLLCVGPAFALHRIYFDGKVVFSKYITSQSIPSGSTINIDENKSFKIYWGENDQDIGTPSELGSNLGHICYIVWDQFLVENQVWPEITYDIEALPIDSGNPLIQRSIVTTDPETGTYYDILDTMNGFPSVNYLDTAGDRVSEFTDKYAAIKFQEISSDLTSWDTVVGSITYFPLTDENVLLALSGGISYASRTGLKNYPGAGKSIRISFDMSHETLGDEDYISRLTIWNSTKTVRISEFDYFTLVNAPSINAFPEPGIGFTYSAYNIPPAINTTHIDIVYTPEDDTYKEQDYIIEFTAKSEGTQPYNYSIRNLVIDASVEYPIRSLSLIDNIDSPLIPEDITSWTVTDFSDGIVEYIDNTDGDFISMPAEVSSSYQNRMEVTNTVDINQVYARNTISGFLYPSPGNQLQISFFLYPYDGTVRVGAAALTGTYYWYTDLECVNGIITPIPENSDTAVVVEATSESTWRKITVTHTIPSSDSGLEGATFSFATQLSNRIKNQATEAVIADLDFGEVSQATRIELNEEINVLVDNTYDVAYRVPSVVSGANAAGAIHQLLFQPYPHGAGLDENDFDITSLEDLSLLMAEERLSMSIIASEGRDLEAVLASILQDIGAFMFWDSTQALWSFKAIRVVEDETEITDIPTNILSSRPETIINTDDSTPNQVVYGFSDLSRRYKETTLLYDNDGEVTQDYGGSSKRSRKTRIPNVIDIKTATKVAERRSQEEHGKSASYRLEVAGISRQLNPGDLITLEGDTTQPLRVLSVNEKPSSHTSYISAMLDVYGIPDSLSDVLDGDDGVGTLIPKEDLLNRLAEIPRPLTNNQNLVMDMRVRAEEQVIGANVYVSFNNTTYFQDSTNFNNLPGGILNQDFQSTSLQIIDQGPVVSIKGLDADKLLDLSSSQEDWYNGKQIVIIGEEWMFLKKSTFINSTQVRLEGLIRARYGSYNASHIAGSEVYILTADLINSIVTRPAAGATLYAKNSTFNATGGSLPVSEVDEVSRFIKGDGTRPMPVYGINTPELSSSYLTGGDAILAWKYRNGNSPNGAGSVAAGEPHYAADPEGTFTLTIKDGSTVKRTVTGLTSPTYTYTNANMVSDFGAEPASFTVTVINISSTGLVSDETSTIISKA